MKLKDLVGKMAIRTAETIGGTNVCPPFGFDFTQPLFPFEAVPPRKYMDKPVKIINVKEDQVVVEDNGVRKLLERKYIDGHWADYEKLLHPEKEEQEKTEEMAKELRSAAEPLRKFLKKYYDPAVKVVVEAERIMVEGGELQTTFQKEKAVE